MEKITVIVPVYNRANILHRCLDSIISSSYKNINLIIVDDGSTDNSLEIAKKFKCKIIKLEKNRGAAYARNIGVKNSKTEYVVMIDSDIIIKKDTIKQLLISIKNYDVVMAVHTEKNEFNNFSSQYKQNYINYRHRQDDNSSYIDSSCFIIRKKIYESFSGMNIEYKQLEDYDLGLRMSLEGKKIFMNKNIEVLHLKKLNLYQLINLEFIRSKAKTIILLKNKSNIGTKNMILWEYLISIPLSFVIVVMLSLSFIYSKQIILNLLILMYSLFIIVNYKFLNYIRKNSSKINFSLSIPFLFLDVLIIDCGIAAGYISYIYNKITSILQ